MNETNIYKVLHINSGGNTFDLSRRQIVAIRKDVEDKISNREILIFETNMYTSCDGGEIFERLIPGDLVKVEKKIENKNGSVYTTISYKEV